jgi:hypothetical protein
MVHFESALAKFIEKMSVTAADLLLVLATLGGTTQRGLFHFTQGGQSKVQY